MEWLTLEEIAAYLKLSKDAVYQYAQGGKIPAVKLGRQWRFDRTTIDEWLSRSTPSDRQGRQRRPWALAKVLEDFRQRLKMAYGKRFRRLILFGSWARGEATPESDVDLVVLLSNYEDYWKELHRIRQIAYEVTFGEDRSVVLTAFPMRETEFSKGKLPLISAIRQEGRAVA